MTVVTTDDTEVPRPKRSWPAEYRRKVLAQIHAAEASGDPGAVGEIWERERSYSSLVNEWRHQGDREALAVLSDKPAGRQPKARRKVELARLRTRVEEFASAKELLEEQGEVSALWQEWSRHSAGRSAPELNTRIEALAARVGLTRACRAFGVPPRSGRHRHQAAEGRLPVRPSAEPTPSPLPTWTLPGAGRVRGLLCWPRFCDLAPAQVFDVAYGREGIRPEQSAIHSDRGSPRTSRALADLFETLGVTRSPLRPRTNTDNPSFEATLETVTDRPDYPDRFEATDEVRVRMGSFVHRRHVRAGPGPRRHPRSAPQRTPRSHCVISRRLDPQASQPAAREPVGTWREPYNRFPSEEEG